MSTGSLSRRSGAAPATAHNPSVVAVIVAALCTLALGALVLFVEGSIGTNAPSLTAPQATTGEIRQPEEPAKAAMVLEAATETPAQPSPTAMATTTTPPTMTPIPTATLPPTPVPTATPTSPPTPEPVWEAAGAGMATFASDGWKPSGEILVKSSAQVPGHTWLTAPQASPGGAFAIEAEIAIDPPASGACDASYGLVVNAQAIVWGAGVAFPCEREQQPVARISDISNPSDGFANDRVIRQKSAWIDPAGWHTLRLEVRGNDLRLSLDGELIVKAEDQMLADVDNAPALPVGLWSDGVVTQVRRFAVYPLDPAAPITP